MCKLRIYAQVHEIIEISREQCVQKVCGREDRMQSLYCLQCVRRGAAVARSSPRFVTFLAPRQHTTRVHGQRRVTVIGKTGSVYGRFFFRNQLFGVWPRDFLDTRTYARARQQPVENPISNRNFMISKAHADTKSIFHISIAHVHIYYICSSVYNVSA